MVSNQEEVFKIVTLGEENVGKTSLITRYALNKFHTSRKSTENISSVNKLIVIKGRDFKLNIWDTAGQERFRVVAPNYYRGALGAILVYDITEKQSFEAVVRWVNELSMQGEEGIQMVIVGNKSDLEYKRDLPDSTALEYAKLIHAPHYHTSARTGDNVEEAFLKLADMIYNKQTGRTNTARCSRKGRGVSVDRRISNANPPKKSCC